MNARTFMYYDLELKCVNCGYSAKFTVGPEISINGKNDIPVLAKRILYCGVNKELVNAVYRITDPQTIIENRCTSCGKKMDTSVESNLNIPGINHVWDANHLEIDYSLLLLDNPQVPVPCPQCLQHSLARIEIERRLESTEILDDIEGK